MWCAVKVTAPAHPAPTALVRPCTSSLASRIRSGRAGVIEKILTHLQEKVVPGPKDLLPQRRAPPAGLFDWPDRTLNDIRLLLPKGRGRISIGFG